MKLHPRQQEAVDLICSERFGIVTGGAGTGKTTCLRAALERLEYDGVYYALCAPTGKAAKRMTEATGREARTIHRLLCYTPVGFARNEHNPLDEDVVIVDEASMVDVELMRDLLRAVQGPTRLILMGDANQLPSVGPGKVLADCIKSGSVPVIRLTAVHRAAADSWVCTEAPKVLTGGPLDLSDRKDFGFVEADSMEDAQQALMSIARQAPTQILTPQKTTDLGVDKLNARLQAFLNPARGTVWKMGARGEFRVGDPVIHTKNNYDLEVFNGETGRVARIDRELLIDFDGAPVLYNRELSGQLRLAYALTIHKSQGSEWPRVAVVCHSAHTYMLSRQLLYTALTRAKEEVFIVGNRQGLGTAMKARRDGERCTELAEMMADAEAA